MIERFAPIEPYRSGMLDVGDGQLMYWEESGNPEGLPVLVLHGGPGSGTTPGGRRNWDPARYRIIQLDQRNCGRSTPSASDPTTDLALNTTHYLIADIESLRQFLRVDRWVLWGGSWGVTLALAYAQKHPERVVAMILISVTMTRRSDVHWLYHETGRYLPEQWQRFRDGVPEAEREGDLVAAYNRLLNESDDLGVRREAAQRWCDWEDAALSLEPGWKPSERFQDEDFRLQFARIVSHYFHHGAWLEEGQLLREIDRLRGIPAVLIHGQHDLGSPVDVPWLLAQSWPEAELHIVKEAGHSGSEKSGQLILQAAEKFSQLS
ncbi:prolyl aminopeptidase [Psychromicrobium lacuslunae]|uniref:Proline iminopeptidase n=1 Tax=Psychromicrobium lacuslunae TaxID=1618207 RepID=A0A0D4C1S8_9MICC|nr:prolyl aminopeptidase [Psychromicrobium lacuslunae]AJT42326.1 proline iminopeptidase [Psychromicrobium lacuslunae]